MTNDLRTVTDNLDELLAVLPLDLQAAVALDERAKLMEIVLDLRRPPEARFRRKLSLFARRSCHARRTGAR
jgi:stage III sporulation protein SpoIIIAA